jgi:hypothetical protein
MHERIFFPLAALICLAMVIGSFAPVASRPSPKAVEAKAVGNALVFDVPLLNQIYGSKETPIAQGPRPGGQVGVRMVSRGPREGGGRAATLVFGPETAAQIAGKRIEVTINARLLRDYSTRRFGVSFGGGQYGVTPPLSNEFRAVSVVLDAPQDANSLRFWPDMLGEDRGVEVKGVSLKVLS